MILLLVIGEKSANKKESRERERERKRSAQKSNTVALVSSSFEKKFTSFPAKTLCAAWRGTHSQIKISQSPPRTRVPFIVLFEHVTS